MKVLALMLCFVAFMVCSAQTVDVPDWLKPETITLRYDKTKGCYLGDTVNFAVSLNADACSKVVYVDWLHPNGEVIMSKKLKLDENMRASGALPVDTLYGSGLYEIRAYTRFSHNFSPCLYPHYVVPVYCPESKCGKEPNYKTRYISTRCFENRHAILLENSYMPDEIEFKSLQPAETQLMVFGKIACKKNISTIDSLSLYDKHFNVVVSNLTDGFSGDVVTDSSGYFMVTLLDTLSAEWNLLMYEKRTNVKGVFAAEELIPFKVEFLEEFAPPKATYTQKEISAKVFGFSNWKDDKLQSKTMSNFWNCDAYAIRDQIKGEVARGLYSWLGTIDKNFAHTKGVASPTVMNLYPDSICNIFIDLNFPNGNDSNDPSTVCVNGPSYNGRPIVWIVNGEYRMVTSMNKSITDFEVLRPSRRHVPQYLDEVKNVFVTDAPDAFFSYVRCSVLEKKKPITVFINTHKRYIWNDSALMTGHLRGYDNYSSSCTK